MTITLRAQPSESPNSHSSLDRVRFDAVVNAGIWLGEVVWNKDEAGVAARARGFEHIIGPTLRSMVRGGRG